MLLQRLAGWHNIGMPVAPPSTPPAGNLVFATPQNRATLSRQSKAGRALRLAPGVYAVGATLPPEKVVYHHRFAIIAHYWPGAVLCDRTALTGGQPYEGWIFIAHPEPARVQVLKLPGVTISVRVGPGQLPGDMPYPEALFLSGAARLLVENVSTAGRPPIGRPARQAGTTAVEDRIDELARNGGAGRVQNVLSQLDGIAPYMPPAAVEVVRRHLVALLGTITGPPATSPRLRARLAGEPYDVHRLDMFARLAEFLQDTAPSPRPALGPASRWEWESFFEAYFSNFIEGTEFGVEEARRIAIEGEVPTARPEDAHDIAATYRIASDPAMCSVTATTSSDLLDLLREQHRVLMAARPDKRPGQLKEQQNYAGGYAFVSPDLVIGTLRRGFDCFAAITDPFQRAVALMLLITECHPFDDGNGRLARLLANAALSHAGQVRIVIPTVYRNNYLVGLSSVSNGAGRGESLLAVLEFAQRWTAAVDWSDFARADEMLRSVNAYVDAAIADATGIHLRMPGR
jgi:hypothetical protein